MLKQTSHDLHFEWVGLSVEIVNLQKKAGAAHGAQLVKLTALIASVTRRRKRVSEEFVKAAARGVTVKPECGGGSIGTWGLGLYHESVRSPEEVVKS